MKTLQDDIKLEQPLDLTLFWQTAAQLPARPNEARSTHAILRCRYHGNGHRCRTFEQMAHELGVTRTRAAELVRRALQRMRAYKAQFVLPGIDSELDAACHDIAQLLIGMDQWHRILFFVPDKTGKFLVAAAATHEHTDDSEARFFLDAWRTGLAEFIKIRLTEAPKWLTPPPA